MSKRGRKRKAGKREKNGRISRAGVCRFDKGTERTQAIQALYGPGGSDAIGRAYHSGLLGEGSDAKVLLDTARRLSNVYWRAYETGRITCTLGDNDGGSGGDEDGERTKASEEWLNDCLRCVDRMGIRLTFDQLVLDPHPDHGPDWLDRLCYGAQTHGQAEQTDISKLREALDALETIAA